MARTSEEQATFDRFTHMNERLQSDVMRRIERSVCGCDYGATSWMTEDEAQYVGELLELEEGKRLLDVGSGSGWPAIYLAEQSQCDIVMTDLPLNGMRIAAQRAAAAQIRGSCLATVADGANLPFPDSTFDAIHHADVLCCLPNKLGVLTACRHVIRVGGKMVFSVISIGSELSAKEYARAVDAGPPFVTTPAPYRQMLHQTGWSITEHKNLTSEYAATLNRMVAKLEAHAEEIAAEIGHDEACDEHDRRRAALEATEQGLLRRDLFVVERLQSEA